MRWALFFVVTLQVAGQQQLEETHEKFYRKPVGTWTVDWSPDAQWIATGGDDSLLRIYNAHTWQRESVFLVNGMIRQVVWHTDGRTIAITTVSSVSIFDLQTPGSVLLKGTTYGARAVDWSSDGTLIAAADGAGVVYIWNNKGDLLKSFPKKDGRSYFSIQWHPYENKLIASGDDIRIIDVETGDVKVIQHREEETGVLTVRWHPSGQFFVSGDYGHHKEGVESLIQFWSETGALIKIIRMSKKEYRAIAWSHNGELLVTTGDALRVWSREGELLFQDTTGQSNEIWGVAWSSDDKQIIAAGFDGSLKLWSARTLVQKRIE